jgi:uncharacterized protein
MPMPARDLWNKIQKELHGKAERAQLEVLKRYLDGWHDSWKGPYADLKRRLLKLATKLESTESVRKAHAPGTSLHVKRQGLGQVPVIGMPNSGKSALVCALTGAPTTIADYPFATQDIVPGMLGCDGGALQLVDTPAVVEGLAGGEGVGRALLAMLVNADALIVVLDLSEDPVAQMEIVRSELAAGNLEPVPNPISTEVHPKGQGGIRFAGRDIPKSDQEVVTKLLTEADVQHAEVIVRASFDQADVAAITARRKRLPTLIAAHKQDVDGADEKLPAIHASHPGFGVLTTDFFTDSQGPEIAGELLRLLGYIRVHIADRAAEDADREILLTRRASSIQEIAEEAKGYDAETVKTARIWGPSVSQPGQTVSLGHLVEDGDVVYLKD